MNAAPAGGQRRRPGEPFTVWGCGPAPAPAPAALCPGPCPVSRRPAEGAIAAVRRPLAAPGRAGGPAPLGGPPVVVDDEWDDMDDFDLSGIEKRFSKPALLSPKDQRAACRAPPRPSSCADKLPGTVNGDAVSPKPGAWEPKGAPPAEEEQPSSQGSVVCLGDLVHCGSDKIVGEDLQENLAAGTTLDDAREEAHTGSGLL